MDKEQEFHLEPCPWCGVEPHWVKHSKLHNRKPLIVYALRCVNEKCFMTLQTFWYTQKLGAAKQWNSYKGDAYGDKY